LPVPVAGLIRWDEQGLRRIAARMAGMGIPPGATLAIEGLPAWLTADVVLAAPYAGIRVFPMAAGLPAPTRERLVRVAGVTHFRGADWVREWSGRSHESGPRSPAPLTASDVQLFVASTGTTGTPKVAMLTGSNLSASVRASAGRMPLNSDDLWLDCLPMHHVGGLMIPLRCRRAGAGVLFHDGFDAGRIWSDLCAWPVTHLSLVPAMLARLLDEAGDMHPPGTLRVVLVGGARLSPDLARRAAAAGWPVWITYGMSECASQVATGRLDGGDPRPLDGFELRVVDERGRPCRGVGRIHVRGPAVMAGYANPELRPGGGLDDGWFITGDLGELRVDGGLRVVGRADDVLVSGGENVCPQEVEAVIAQCPGVDEVVVSARDDAVWGDRLVAVIVGEWDSDQVERWCRRRLRGARLPREFLRRESLPRNALGKLDRRAVRRCLDE